MFILISGSLAKENVCLKSLNYSHWANDTAFAFIIYMPIFIELLTINLNWLEVSGNVVLTNWRLDIVCRVWFVRLACIVRRPIFNGGIYSLVAVKWHAIKTNNNIDNEYCRICDIILRKLQVWGIWGIWWISSLNFMFGFAIQYKRNKMK